MAPLIPLTVFLAVALGVVGLALLWGSERWAVERRLDQLGIGRSLLPAPAPVRVAAGGEPGLLGRIAAAFGKRMPVPADQAGELRRRLMHAGYRDPAALLVYTGTRLLLALGLPLLLILTVVPTMAPMRAMLLLVAAAGGGYLAPSFVLGRLVRRRKGRITDALPDTLDLLVVCVEAGLGLNQALVRVGDEMRHVEPVIADEVNVVNLEIRAGKPRSVALRNFARRTGVLDIESLISMLLQTEQFGTSVATSLRVFADGMRTTRRQRAEEAAAKTTIKIIFPLVFCILPALVVVVLGPAAIQIFDFFVKARFRLP